VLGMLVPAILVAYQGATGQILGTVLDATGAVVGHAAVVVRSTATNEERATSTNDRGLFGVPNLDPGVYDLRVSAKGFETEVLPGLVVEVGADLTVPVRIRVGNLRENVEVKGAAAQVDLASSAMGAVIDERTILNLPLNGRDWTQLATLEPGVATIDAQQVSSSLRVQRGDGIDLTISGGRPVENNYLLNGISINDYANAAPGSSLGINLGVDAIQEFAVLTDTFPAEYGRSAAGVVMAVTKPGSNAFHGDAYYFFRSNVLDARNFFDTTSSPPPFKRNQFGGSAGGPVRRNKMFLFADYEGFRQGLGQTQTSLVPSLAAREGTYVTNGVPVHVAVSPLVEPFLGIYPLPNRGLTSDPNVGVFSFAGQVVSNEDFAAARFDNQFSDKDSLNATFLYDNGEVVQPDEFDNKPLSLPSQRCSGSVDESHTFDASMINSLRAGATRVDASGGYYTSAYNPLLDNPSLGFIPGHNVGSIQVTGLTSFSGGIGLASGNTFNYTSYQLYDDLSLIRGIHSIKVGFNVESIRSNSDSADSSDGTMTFNSLLAFLQDKPFSFAALLPGSDTTRGIRQTIVGGYVQDDIRWRRNLTINLGLRYEMITQPSEENDLLASLKNLTDKASTVGPYFNQNPTLYNFEPRAGFSWDPFGDQKTAVRSGFAMFDVLPLPYVFVNELARATPFYRGGQASNLPFGSFPSGAYALLTPATLRTVYVQPNPSRSYKMEWNFNVQRDLGGNFVLTTGYVGSRGVHLPWRNNNMDTVLPTATSEGYVYPVKGTVLNPGFGRIAGTLFNADSSYNALQTSLVKRFSHGVQGQLSYTFSKSIDDASGAFSSNEYSNTVGIPVPFDTSINRGLSDFDQRQRLAVNGIWDIPAAGSLSGVTRWLTEGWQLSGIFTAASGEPFSVQISGDIAGSKMGSDAAQRPIPVQSPACKSTVNPGDPSDYIKEQCFIFPTPHLITNIVGRNTLTGPGLANLDVALFKNNYVKFISEKANVQFRIESFNTLNHANFAAPISTNSSSPVIFDSTGHLVPSAGMLTATQTPSREFQFGLKVIW
jgi:hypothetical protein